MKNFKKTSRKVLCILIAIIMIVPMGIMSSLAATCTKDDIVPYVYIYGQHEIKLLNDDGTISQPLEEDEYDIAAIAKDLIPLLLNAVATGDWDEYGTALYNVFAPTFEDVRVNGDGYPVNENTYVGKWSYNTVSPNHYNNCGELHGYEPDWRLSPLDVADDLNAFIETVKEKTGHDKVNLVCRCMGAQYAMAYLYKYGQKEDYASINRFITLCGVHNGTEWCDALLSGNIKIDSDSGLRFLTTDSNTAELMASEIGQFLITTYNMLRETYTDKVVISIIQAMYDNIKDSTFAQLFRLFYGSCGGSLSCVNEHFDEAIEYIYPTDEYKAEYAGVIAKATEFHNEVQLHNDDILMDMDAKGVPTLSVVEYGFQQYPLGGLESAKIGDYMASAAKQSNGATVSLVNSTLSDEYIKGRIAAGKEKYISADKQIDASTCLFPNRTWFIKNMNHEFNETLNVMLNFLAVQSKEAPTIDTNANYPQFLNFRQKDTYPHGELLALKQVNDEDIDWGTIEDSEGGAKSFIDTVVEFFKNLLKSLLDKIQELVNRIKGIEE